jgi:hypothetical protein
MSFSFFNFAGYVGSVIQALGIVAHNLIDALQARRVGLLMGRDILKSAD